MGTDIDDDFLHPVCDNIIPFSLLGRDVYLLIYVTSDVCLVDCDMAENARNSSDGTVEIRKLQEKEQEFLFLQCGSDNCILYITKNLTRRI